jgi:hypothetical protein
MAIKDFDDLEQQLQQRLNPVRPDPEFVSHLHYRLVNPEDITLEKRTQFSMLLVVIAGGLFTGALLLWLLRHLR